MDHGTANLAQLRAIWLPADYQIKHVACHCGMADTTACNRRHLVVLLM